MSASSKNWADGKILADIEN
jgi:hypothetical protein